MFTIVADVGCCGVVIFKYMNCVDCVCEYVVCSDAGVCRVALASVVVFVVAVCVSVALRVFSMVCMIMLRMVVPYVLFLFVVFDIVVGVDVVVVGRYGDGVVYYVAFDHIVVENDVAVVGLCSHYELLW